MTYVAEIVTLLKTSAPLTAILTGGITVFEASGAKGINRVQLTQAFKPGAPQFNPTAILYELEEQNTGELGYSPSGYRVTKTPILGWIVDDANAGFTHIDAAYALMYGLLEQQALPDCFQMLWQKTVKDKRDETLGNAAFYEFELNVYGFRSA